MATFLKTTQISIDGARTLPREYYTSPELFGHELEHIFTKRWLCVGREDRLPNPGDWFTQAVGKESIIVLRDREGAYRAFYNVCRHRGTRICEEHSGQFSGTIQCPYHAWTYGLDGRLIGAPSTNDIENFDKADWPLFPVPVSHLGRLPVHQPGRAARAVRAGLGPAPRPLQPVQPAQPEGGADHRLRREVQLEAPVPELLGVLPLRPGAPRPRQAHAAHERRERSHRGTVHRRLSWCSTGAPRA